MVGELRPLKDIVFVGGFVPTHTPAGGSAPMAPDDIGLNPPGQLVLGDLWMAYVSESGSRIKCTTKVKYKIHHKSKSKNRTKKLGN